VGNRNLVSMNRRNIVSCVRSVPSDLEVTHCHEGYGNYSYPGTRYTSTSTVVRTIPPKISNRATSTVIVQTPLSPFERDVKYCRAKVGSSVYEGYVNKGIQTSETELLPTRNIGISVTEENRDEILSDIPYSPSSVLITIRVSDVDESHTRSVYLSPSEKVNERMFPLNPYILDARQFKLNSESIDKSYVDHLCSHLSHIIPKYRYRTVKKQTPLLSLPSQEVPGLRGVVSSIPLPSVGLQLSTVSDKVYNQEKITENDSVTSKRMALA
jgi:hypothetical protein